MGAPPDASALAGLDEESFLAGPGSRRALDVDPIFGKEWARMLEELRLFGPHELEADDAWPDTPSASRPGYQFRSVLGGALLISPEGEAVGGYVGCDLSVDERHRGLGLGAELVAERFLRWGDLPTWHLDEPAYSPAGERAHRAAWRKMSSDPAWVEAKLAALRSPARQSGAPKAKGP